MVDASPWLSVREMSESTKIEFATEYVGVVPVAASVPSQSLWKMFGPQIVQQAAKKLKALNPKVAEGTVVITPKQIMVLNSGTGILMDQEDLVHVKYTAIHPSDKKKAIYVAFAPQVGILYCHVLSFRNKNTTQMVVDAISSGVKEALAAKDEAFGFDSSFIYSMAQPKAFKPQGSEAAELASLGQTIGIVESIRYVGTVPLRMKDVAASKEITKDDVETAASFMLGQLKLHAKKTPKKNRQISFVSRKAAADADPLSGLPVVLIVSAEGIRTIDNISREETHRVFLQDLAYFSEVAVKGDNHGELFAAVSKDDKLRHVRMRLYRCDGKGSALSICDTIQQAFKAANRADELRNGRPFMPIASMTTEIATPLSVLEFDRSLVNPIRPIGAGQFGLVFAVQFFREDPTGGDAVQRAVKVLRPGASTETMCDFLREAEMLQKLDHPNVVKLYGVCLKQKPWLILEEFVNYGDLDAVMKACKEKEIALTESELMIIINQLATGANFVTTSGIVHSDYAARNVLLHFRNQVKIADFGWARQLEGGKKSFFREEIPKISTRWLAPECVERFEFSEKSDVWALAVTIWEIFTSCNTPYEDVHFLTVARMVREGLRLDRPQNCSHDCYAVLSKCWEADIKKRTKMKDMASSISRIATSVINNTEGSDRPRDLGAMLLYTDSETDDTDDTTPNAAPPPGDLAALGDVGPSGRPLSGVEGNLQRLRLAESGEFDGFGDDAIGEDEEWS